MPTSLNRVGRAAIAAIALGFATVGASCAGDDGTSSTTVPPAQESTTTADATIPATPDPPTTDPTTDPTTTANTVTPSTTTGATTTVPTTTDAPVETTEVNVYWGWSVVNPSVGSPERLGAGTRDVAGDVPVRNSLAALFAGSSPAEEAIGMVSSVPSGTRVLGIAIDGTTATVDLSSEFALSSGSLDETMRLAQVVFTVTQFDGIDRVKFFIDGEPQDPILSTGFEVGDGFTRDSFPNVRPIIMIEQPFPGADVSDPLVIRGESNTFEATVRYAITTGGGDGVVMTEGFTTASGGNGTWGDFEVSVDFADFSDYQSGPGSIIMWEDSPRDGARVDIVEIPIVLPAID